MPYSVYLRVSASGQGARVHVPDLPGCSVAGAGKQDVLVKLPHAIAGYLDWLKRHGELLAQQGDPAAFEIADEGVGAAALCPGDDAWLFPPDLVPLTDDDMERYLRLMSFARDDLMALVSGLHETTLDWQPATTEWSIRTTLRHIGNAEEWYVSRLVPPNTLPPEWEHDEGLPIFRFMEMERRTAVARLRQLTSAERSDVVHPGHWTRHPDEPWTARKVFRRFLEHEREHTAQIRDILARYHTVDR
jgi:predicted RNase H-like HicB family nuclease/uncharacterized damage-inducible protein DinB